jgi:hypothetical protein
MLSHINGWNLTHPYIGVYSLDGNKMIAEYSLHLSSRPMAYLLCAGQKNQTQRLWDIRKALILIMRWGISTASFCWPPKHTQNMVFQCNVSRSFWSQHKRQPPHSVTRGTNKQIQHSHERPTLPLSWIHCILQFFFWYGTPSLTQINSIYLTIFSKFAATAITSTYLLSEC